MNKFKLLLITCLLCFGQHSLAEDDVPLGYATPAAPKLKAKSYVLMDYDSGQVIAEHNAEKIIEPASLTKMMTVYITDRAIKDNHIQLDDKVTISEKAWKAPGSRMFVKVHSEVAVRDLLKGIIIQSGNDASIAMAEYLGDTEEKFVELMNAESEALGMKNTHFANATGLPNKELTSTAYDLALLSRAIIRDFPESYAVYSQKWFTYNGIKQMNRNRLLWRNPHVDGIKTGHTDTAGYSLAASAKKGDMRLIAVVIGAHDDNARAEETNRLFQYAFRFYETHALYKAQETLAEPYLWMGAARTAQLGTEEPVYVTIPRGQYKKLKATMHITKHIEAPIQKGQNFGTLSIKLNDKILLEKPLISLTTVAKGNIFRRTKDSIAIMFSHSDRNKT